MIFYNSQIQFCVKALTANRMDVTVRKQFKEKFLLVHCGRRKKCGFHTIQKPFRHIFRTITDCLQWFVFMRRALCFAMTKRDQAYLLFSLANIRFAFAMSHCHPAAVEP